MASTTWSEYVESAIHGDTPAAAARRINASRSTIVRWLDHGLPTPSQAVALARAYGRPPGSALVAAGYLTNEDLEGEQYDIASVPDETLIDEVRRRFNR